MKIEKKKKIKIREIKTQMYLKWKRKRMERASDAEGTVTSNMRVRAKAT